MFNHKLKKYWSKRLKFSTEISFCNHGVPPTVYGKDGERLERTSGGEAGKPSAQRILRQNKSSKRKKPLNKIPFLDPRRFSGVFSYSPIEKLELPQSFLTTTYKVLHMHRTCNWLLWRIDKTWLWIQSFDHTSDSMQHNWLPFCIYCRSVRLFFFEPLSVCPLVRWSWWTDCNRQGTVYPTL